MNPNVVVRQASNGDQQAHIAIKKTLIGRGDMNSQRRPHTLSFFGPRIPCCGSSVVEHSLGKGEVESSILSHSTMERAILPPTP